jgi:hypothetical protein
MIEYLKSEKKVILQNKNNGEKNIIKYEKNKLKHILKPKIYQGSLDSSFTLQKAKHISVGIPENKLSNIKCM